MSRSSYHNVAISEDEIDIIGLSDDDSIVTTERYGKNDESQVRDSDSNFKEGISNQGESDDMALTMKMEFESKFRIGAEFDNIDALRNQANDFGTKYNCPLVTLKSSKKAQSIAISCKFGGNYREAKKGSSKRSPSEKQPKQRVTYTGKVGCECLIKASYIRYSKKVTINFTNASHNHRISKDSRDYPIKRLSHDDKLSLLQRRSLTEVLQIGPM